jgi:uncharacterized protein
MGSFLRGGLLLLALAFAGPALADPTFPQLTGRVVDQADIIPDAVEQRIDAKLTQLEEKTTDQFVVVTVKSLEDYDIQDYGVRLGRAWGIGQKGKNNGLILLVAPNERKVGFQVGYGLEGTMTDALTQVIIQNAILPRFRANDYPTGIERGVDDAIQVLSGDAQELQKLAEKRPADDGFWSGISPVLIVFAIFIIIRILSSGGGGGGGLGRRRRSGVLPWIITSAILNARSSSGGGSSWGSSSGGGFSGGGGSFGGGGSSGSW